MHYKAFTKTFDFGDGRSVTLETGKLAKQAHGSVVLTMGKTMILATVVSNYEAKEDLDFLPLSVDYQEKFAAVGRIPGSFLRRESRLSDYEILICRIVDRAIRPLFPDDYHAETQVNISLISSDENILPDALVGLATSAALCITDIPFQGPISEVRIARVDGKFIINPYKDQLEKSDLDLIVSGTANELNMVEGEMTNASEADMVEALKLAHDCIKKQCAFQLEFCDLMGGRKPAREYNHEVNDEDLKLKVRNDLYDKLYEVAKVPSNKDERSAAFKAILDEYLLAQGDELTDSSKKLIKRYFGKAKKEAVRNMMLDTRVRLDGRALDEIRPIWSEVDYLPAAHGSSVFTRGETQSLTSVTLGGKLDQQLLDSPMEGDFLRLDLKNLIQEDFILIGNFPYNISTQIVFKMLENRGQIPFMAGMFQKEVAQRIASKPGSKTYGILSVLTQAFYEVKLEFSISPGAFFPPPKVDSAVISCLRKPVFSLDCNETLFFDVVKTAFNQRRKTLLNSLNKYKLRTTFLNHPFAKLRPETLNVDQFIELTRFLESNS